MKSVLISIQPKWVEKIAKGEKTIEVRKTRPTIETPFKCYIYCTNSGGTLHTAYDGLHYHKSYIGETDLSCINGKVIGEFVCDRIEYITPSYGYLDARCIGGAGYILDKCCMNAKDLIEYGKGKELYGWHISGLKIYDKPKELSEFTPICKYKGERCEICCFYEEAFGGCCSIVTRPPQSWCYVED